MTDDSETNADGLARQRVQAHVSGLFLQRGEALLDVLLVVEDDPSLNAMGSDRTPAGTQGSTRVRDRGTVNDTPTPAHLAKISDHNWEILTHAKKALIEETMVHVDNSLIPAFRIRSSLQQTNQNKRTQQPHPNQDGDVVRALPCLVGDTGFEPVTSSVSIGSYIHSAAYRLTLFADELQVKGVRAGQAVTINAGS